MNENNENLKDQMRPLPAMEYLARVRPSFLQELIACPSDVYYPVFEEMKEYVTEIAVFDRRWWQRFDRITIYHRGKAINTFFLEDDYIFILRTFFSDRFINNKCEG